MTLYRTVRWIGDVHGEPNFDPYANLIKTDLPTRQIGDFGLGFGTPPTLADKDRFHRGNHDDPARCRAHPNWIPDGTLLNGVFHIGGAASHDRARLVENVTWWRDEELDLAQWDRIYGDYTRLRPKIVATHDAPERIKAALFPRSYDEPPSRTRQALDGLLEIHAPDLWIFGHWHRHADATINGVRYICLAELDHIDLPTLID